MHSDPGPCIPDADKDFSPNGVEKYISRAGLKLFILAAVAAASLLFIHFTGIKEYLGNIHKIKEQLDNFGIWAPLMFAAVVAPLVALGAPRLLFCALGGMAFGFLQGLIWSQVGTLLGAYLTFVFARWGGRQWVGQKIAGLESKTLKKLIDNPSVLSVFLIRQVPVGGFFINLFLGVTSISTGTFLLGSLLGFLPEAVVVTLIGSGLGKESAFDALFQVLIAVVCAALILGIALWKKRHGKRCNAEAFKQK